MSLQPSDLRKVSGAYFGSSNTLNRHKKHYVIEVVFSSDSKQTITSDPISMDIHCKDSRKLPNFIRSGLKLKFPSKVKDHNFSTAYFHDKETNERKNLHAQHLLQISD